MYLYRKPPQNLADLVERARENMSDVCTDLVVRREHVLEDALRTVKRFSFDANSDLQVSM